MKRTFLKMLPFIMAMGNYDKIPENDNKVPVKKGRNNMGAFGYSGIIGTNADKKIHFNKKRHGVALRRKHRKMKR